MVYRIAALWGCDIKDVYARLDAEGLQGWIAYYSIEPWGDHWRTFANAYAAAGIASCAGHKNQKVKSFMPDLEPKRRQTAEEMEAVFNSGIANSEHRIIDG